MIENSWMHTRVFVTLDWETGVFTLRCLDCQGEWKVDAGVWEEALLEDRKIHCPNPQCPYHPSADPDAATVPAGRRGKPRLESLVDWVLGSR